MTWLILLAIVGIYALVWSLARSAALGDRERDP